MSALDALAAIGEIGLGFDKTRVGFDKAAREAALEELRIEEARRRAAEAQYEAETRALMRAAAAKYGLGGANQIPAQPEVVRPAVPFNDVIGDEANANQGPVVPERRVAGAPAQADDLGMLREQERIARARLADPKLEESLTKARKNIEAEGYRDFLAGIVSDQDPEIIKRKFNAKGAQKISSMEKDPSGVYTVTYEDGATQRIDKKTANHLGVSLGIFKKEPDKIVPPGSMLIPGDGGPPVRNEERFKDTAAGIQLTNDLAIERDNFRARARQQFGGGNNRDTARQKDYEFLLGMYPEDPDKALNIAFHIGKEEDPEKRMLRWMREVRQDPRNLGLTLEEVRAKAKSLMELSDSIAKRPSSAAPRAAPAAPQAAAPQAAAPASSGPEELGDPKNSPAGGFKIDTPPAERQSIIAFNGKTYTWNDILATAKRRKMTTQEVIARVRKESEATP